MRTSSLLLLAFACVTAATDRQPGAPALPAPSAHDFIVKNFRFQSGDTLPEIRLHPVKTGRMVLIPASPETEGHRTQVKASVWREHVREFVRSLK